MRFAKLSIKTLTLALLLTGCETFQLHPFEVGVTLPYSKNCRFKNVMTKEVREISPDECQAIKDRSMILTSEAWKVIRSDIQVNCQFAQCKQLQGQLDAIFLALDKGLQAIPWQ